MISFARWLVGVCLALVVCYGPAHSSPAIEHVRTAETQVGRFDIFTADFDVSSVASNPYWPYDAAPPAGIPAGAGVSVDGLFSCDNWATTKTVPAFLWQGYERRLVAGSGQSYNDEYLTPNGQSKWMIRFAPTVVGTWHFKIRVEDSSGVSYYPAQGDSTFECVPSQNPGFVRVSSRDPRYFERSDGKPLLSIGTTSGFHTTYEAETALEKFGRNGINTVRWWMTFRGWQAPFFGGSENPQWRFTLSLSNSGGCKDGARYCGEVSPGMNTRQGVWLQRNRLYRLTGYMKTSSVGGAVNTGGIAYIGLYAENELAKSLPSQGTSGWAKFTIDYTPSADVLAVVGVKHTGTGGTVYFDDLSLKDRQDDGLTWSSEYLSKADFDFQNYVDQPQAWKVDRIFEAARNNSVYLKTVISEKQDFTLGCIAPDGSTVARSDNNFYASDNHPSRWLQKASWRYMTGRWGCYTSLHSWELCNEGDPFNGNHWNAANALATYVHEVDPNEALCTTSFWHSIPMEFWKTSACDYLDVHEYFGPTTAGTGSHGPRIYAWGDALYDASSVLPVTSDGGSVSLDTSIKHSRSTSIKLVANPGGGNLGFVSLYPEYHIGIDPTHTYTLSFWAKGENITNPGGGLGWVRPGVLVTYSKAYHENDFVTSISADAELGTYDWKQYQVNIQPAAQANTANIRVRTTYGPTQTGTFWVDDIQFIDNVTGRDLFADGGFERGRIDYDTALAVSKYGTLLQSYAGRVAKPVVWGETGVRGPNLFGSPYKGYTYTDENQQLVDDNACVYLKKMIWAHTGPDNPNMLYWWLENASRRNMLGYFRAFQDFMRGIEVNNGHYEDAQANCSSATLRAWGQKDLTNHKAHLWIDNAPYTWKNVVDGVNVPPVSGTVTVSGLRDGKYKVEWWDTSTGTVTRTEEVQCTGQSIQLTVQNLQSDIACKILPKPAKVDLRVLVQSDKVIPGQIVTITLEYTNSGESDGKDVEVSAAVPALMQYVAGSAEESGGVYDPVAQTVKWIIDVLPAHQTGTRTYRARVL